MKSENNLLKNVMKMPSYIGVGSNLQNPVQQVTAAINEIGHLPDTQLLAVSSLYKTQPVGLLEQPDFINAVLKIETGLTALTLLYALQGIEQQHGRPARREKFIPRTLDLDILLYDQLVLMSQDLTLPHYALKERAFVLVPLHEIEPDLILPDGTYISSLLAKQDLTGVELYAN